MSHLSNYCYFILDETPDLSQPEWEDIHLITGKKIIFALHL